MNDGPPGQAFADHDAHDLGDGLGAALAAHGAFCNGFAVQGDGLGILAAPHITATAAIGAGQRFIDGDDPRVLFHIEFLARPSETIGQHHRHDEHGSGG